MKKTYLKPETLTVKIANHLMLITSDTAAQKNSVVLGRESRFSDSDFEDEE